MRRGYQQITFEVLGELLKLPEGCVVKDIRRGRGDPFPCCFEVLLEGTGLPEVHESERAPQVDIVHTHRQASHIEFAGFV